MAHAMIDHGYSNIPVEYKIEGLFDFWFFGVWGEVERGLSIWFSKAYHKERNGWNVKEIGMISEEWVKERDFFKKIKKIKSWALIKSL
jgi:hypothetical protein